MPYVSQILQDKNAQMLSELREIESPGELNYLVTKLCLSYLKTHGKSYQTLNDVSGALTNANLEFYRRVTVDYEQEKININGDVY